MTKRKGGGQPGNTNAIKSGYYSHTYRPLELSDLETELRDGLTDEIANVRVAIRRLMEIANGEENKGDLMDTLALLVSSGVGLAHMLRTQESLGSRTTEVATLLSRAIQEAMDDWKTHPL